MMRNPWPEIARGAHRGTTSPRGSVAIGLLLLFIALVSVHDAALVVLNCQVILEYERNPLGRWMIETNGGDVWPFVVVKLLGTSLVCASILCIRERSQIQGFLVAGALAAFQAGLLFYLCST